MNFNTGFNKAFLGSSVGNTYVCFVITIFSTFMRLSSQY